MTLDELLARYSALDEDDGLTRDQLRVKLQRYGYLQAIKDLSYISQIDAASALLANARKWEQDGTHD